MVFHENYSNNSKLFQLKVEAKKKFWDNWPEQISFHFSRFFLPVGSIHEWDFFDFSYWTNGQSLNQLPIDQFIPRINILLIFNGIQPRPYGKGERFIIFAVKQSECSVYQPTGSSEWFDLTCNGKYLFVDSEVNWFKLDLLATYLLYFCDYLGISQVSTEDDAISS